MSEELIQPPISLEERMKKSLEVKILAPGVADPELAEKLQRSQGYAEVIVHPFFEPPDNFDSPQERARVEELQSAIPHMIEAVSEQGVPLIIMEGMHDIENLLKRLEGVQGEIYIIPTIDGEGTPSLPQADNDLSRRYENWEVWNSTLKETGLKRVQLSGMNLAIEQTFDGSLLYADCVGSTFNGLRDGGFTDISFSPLTAPHSHADIAAPTNETVVAHPMKYGPLFDAYVESVPTLDEYNAQARKIRELVATHRERVLNAFSQMPTVCVQLQRPDFSGKQCGHVDVNQGRVFSRSEADFVGTTSLGPCVGLVALTDTDCFVFHASGLVPREDVGEIEGGYGIDILHKHQNFFKQDQDSELTIYIFGDNQKDASAEDQYLNDDTLVGIYLWLESRDLVKFVKGANVRDSLGEVQDVDSWDHQNIQSASNMNIAIDTKTGVPYPGISLKWQGIQI